jgi:hypothetical protein
MKTSKYKIGQKIYYIPKLSGLNNKKPLIIKNIMYKKTDSLSELLNVQFKPTFLYSFENTSLSAIENDLSDIL